jgi:hypothetical protein
MAKDVIISQGPEAKPSGHEGPEPGKSKPQTADAALPRKQRKAKAKLLFIDTNIFLDFYRARNDAGISLLSKIDALHEQTITTCQVAMEFKKNRQKVITESVSLLKPPEFNLSTPAFLSDAATVKVIKDRIHDVKRRVEKMKDRILSTMENPKTHDRIYQTIQRLFNNTGPLNLRHDTPEYKAVWRKALRRFLEGRPPRKKEDTSAGDAINWEWIIHCIQKTNRDVIIVSRDADYGLTLDGKGYANNWLTDEVKERVNQQRKLILVDRLSAALKLLDVKVTREEITSEREIIKSTAPPRNEEVDDLIDIAIHGLLNGEEMSSLIAETNTCGWSCNGYSVDHIDFKDGIWTAPVSFSFSGEQEDDKPWCGDTISGRCIVEIDQENNIAVSEFEADVEKDYDPMDDVEDDDPQEESSMPSAPPD